jgi:2-polyprenyl-3-methyl-5-hydroxy-6-metoxy-1,4-benzoquinol methylase
MSLETIPCDLCGGEDFKRLYPGTITDPDHDPSTYYSSSRTQAGYLPIVRCLGCGLTMTNPRDDLQTIKRVYETLNDPVYDEEDDNRRRTALTYLHLLRRFSPNPGKLLDVGCATGVFACEAKTQGWQVTGLEASIWSLAQARQRCDQVVWLNSLLENADISPGSFQVITLWDVLEHVNSPTQVMSLLRTWLVPGGRVFLNLPNSASLTARVSGSRWVLLLREHLWYFSPTTMRYLLEKTGFTLIHSQPNFVRFSLMNIATRLGQYPGFLGHFGKRIASIKTTRDIKFTFPMGEMNVVAQLK